MGESATIDRLRRLSVEITRIEEELDHLEGTPCEVYSRVVGYYRPVKNWNKGKREEFRDRVTFKA